MNRALSCWLLLTVLAATSPLLVQGEAPRAARSVHLSYPAPDGALFYNELMVDQSTRGSYFMACGWNTGYFGIQELDAATNKVVLFSVWDPTKGDDANRVPLEQRVEVLYTGAGVTVSRFGGEGTGGKSMWPYLWQTNEICRFMVHAVVAGEKTSYAGWCYDRRNAQWKHLVTFRTRTGGQPLRGYYSFVEDFRRDGASAQEVRRARFGHGWVRDVHGNWLSLARARFTASNSTWEAVDTIDAGRQADWFYLATGGNVARSRELGTKIESAAPSAPQPKDLPGEITANHPPDQP